MQPSKEGSYYLEYVAATGKLETMKEAFVAGDDNAAEKHARKKLAELGVSEGSLFRCREDGAGESTEICQVSIRRTGT